MPYRKSLVFTLWLTSSLALLALVIVAPSRKSEYSTASSQLNSLRPSLAEASDQSTACLNPALATDAVFGVDALACEETEEQDRADALNEPRVCFLIPSSFRQVPDRQSIAPRWILSRYPLRC